MGFKIVYEMSPGLFLPRKPTYYVWETKWYWFNRLLGFYDNRLDAEQCVARAAAFQPSVFFYDKYGNDDGSY